MIREAVALRIRELSQARGLDSGYKLAAKCVGVGRQTLYNTLKGKSSPTLETLELICQGLEVTLEEFFDWDTKKIILSGDERMAFEKTRQLAEKDRQRILAYIDLICEQAAARENPERPEQTEDTEQTKRSEQTEAVKQTQKVKET